MRRHNWKQIAEEIENLGPFQSIATAAAAVQIPYGTVRDAFHRGDLPRDLIGGEESETKFSLSKAGNSATLRFKSAEPLSAEDAAELAGIDLEEWMVEKETVNIWPMGRKAKRVSMSWEEGKARGFVEDSGKLHKEYMYQITVIFARRKPVAVKPVIARISITDSPEYPPPAKLTPKASRVETTLFIADPHFGFRRGKYGLEPFHHRSFLASLLRVAREFSPDNIVWNGDLLDLADFSTFPSTPDQVSLTQLAGIEAAYVLKKFREATGYQIILEGNHDVRLKKSLAKNMAAAYGLKPVQELEEEDLISVPRFLGLKDIDTEWVEGYPNSSFENGSAKFFHGDIVRKGSGRTVSAIVDDSIVSKFFGHIHRMELAQKYLPDWGRSIYVGSPGCACSHTLTPGVTYSSNWQLGAFFITQNYGHVVNVEHISRDWNGEPTFFRGEIIPTFDYEPGMLDSLPREWAAKF